MKKSWTDLELFEAIQVKQPAALEQLYGTYADLMYGLALHILKNAQDAEDLVHEVFVSQWQHCTFNPTRGSFKTYLLLLVRSRALDYLRTRQSRQNVLIRASQDCHRSPPEAQPFEAAVVDELTQRVRAALADLPENQCQALLMAYFEGRTQQDIAEQFAVPIGTVKSWFRLGFTKLRRSLIDLTAEPGGAMGKK